ncbi:unnamed protein product [Urochloa decumbens]|uniref:F-box domain-containing protein n=1 Tax=Urochloa decumbens TaxID=240449 RepID=A0ABC9BY90_9POAL
MTDTPGAKSAKEMDEGDRISGLPDEVRHHVLSFLPARDAARTCVLSPMWRQLWASAPRLKPSTRGCIPLESFWLRANGTGIFLENFCDTVNMWICYALRSNVEELGVDDYNQNDRFGDMKNPIEFFQLQHCPFTSSYLKKLHLCYVYINNRGLKKLFSRCPVLEDLEMINCEIFNTEKFGGQPEFSSASLKSLCIKYVDFPYARDYEMSGCYIVINMPSLVSLHVGTLGLTQLSLVDVQSLITAAIVLNTSIDTFADCCKILGALSNVKKLELLFPYDLGWQYEYSMQDDTHLCGGVFTNLITLSLSDWCLYDNCKLLLYLLEHSPNLEKLTLKLSEPCFHGNIGLSCSAAAADSATPFNCEKLRKVEIVCSKGNKIVGKLVTILLTKMKSPPEISIKPFSGVS